MGTGGLLETPVLRTATGSLGSVVDHEQVVQPLNGRTLIVRSARAGRRPSAQQPPSRASMADARERTSICMTASPCCSPSLARWRSTRSRRRDQEFNESNSPPAEFDVLTAV